MKKSMKDFIQKGLGNRAYLNFKHSVLDKEYTIIVLLITQNYFKLLFQSITLLGGF